MAGDDWDNAFEGAAGGAMAGSAFGPWGTAIGGLVGGAAGYFGNQGQGSYQDQLKQLADRYSKRPPPQMENSAFRGNQAALIAQLEAMARGEGPSAATMQMREAMDRAVAGEASAAAGAGGRGVNPGAAYRQASDQATAAMTQGARDTAILRAKEQMAVLGELNSAITAGRQADENVGHANLLSKLQTMGLNDEGQLKALLAVMQAAGPSMGQRLLAGGASAMPGILQMMNAKNNQKPQPYSPNGLDNNQGNGWDSNMDDGDWNWTPGPVTSPNY